MVTVYLIDGETHVHLPSSAWGHAVREKLSEMGHTVQATDQNWALNTRDNQEMLRMSRLLDSTGL